MRISLFPASRAAHIKALQVLGLYNLLILEYFLEGEPTITDEFRLKHHYPRARNPKFSWEISLRAGLFPVGIHGTRGNFSNEETTISFRSTLLFCPLRPSDAPCADHTVFPVSGATILMLNR
jgi:hypothetical protein